MIGETLNQYRITATLGAGGMGEVPRACDTRWIIHGSTHPKSSGIAKIRLDGTDAQRLVKSATLGNAEVSPEGKFITIAMWEQFFSIMMTDALPSL